MRMPVAMREHRHCCNREQEQKKLRHIRNSLAISSLRSGQSLLSLAALFIGGVGIADLTG
jgi:hypothetical protein